MKQMMLSYRQMKLTKVFPKGEKQMNKKERIPCMIMRGGTSKGVFFLENDLPQDAALRDQTLLQVMGSPDPKQINGLGGATSM